MNRLLYRWEKRQRFIKPSVLHETRARLHPSFELKKYREHIQQKKKPKVVKAPYLANQINVFPHQQPIPEEIFLLGESEYWTEVEKTVQRLLKELQKEESEESQLSVALLKQMKPELYEMVSFSLFLVLCRFKLIKLSFLVAYQQRNDPFFNKSFVVKTKCSRRT